VGGYLSFNTPLFSILKASCRSSETVFVNFMVLRIAHIHCIIAVPSMSLSTTRLHSCGVIKCLAMDSTWPQTPPVFLLCVAVIFLPPSMEPIHHLSVSPTPCHLAVFVMSLEVFLEAPSISRKAEVLLPLFHCFLYTCHTMHCGFCGLTWFVGRLLGI